jgi:hypothetical protein
MTSRVAIALCLLLSLSGASLASGPAAPSGAGGDNPGATGDNGEAAAPSAEDQDTGQEDGNAGNAAPGKQEPPPIDVHRFRPGACPEGPPCKGDE